MKKKVFLIFENSNTFFNDLNVSQNFLRLFMIEYNKKAYGRFPATHNAC